MLSHTQLVMVLVQSRAPALRRLTRPMSLSHAAHADWASSQPNVTVLPNNDDPIHKTVVIDSAY